MMKHFSLLELMMAFHSFFIRLFMGAVPEYVLAGP